jgi:5-methylcytosine-specific restriction endonuclease McrA
MKNDTTQEDRLYFKIRRKYLQYRLKRVGILRCHYCGVNNLIINYRFDQDAMLVATIDHVVPLIAGIDRFDWQNWVVSCKECNQAKGDTDYDMFIKMLPYILSNRRKRLCMLNELKLVGK